MDVMYIDPFSYRDMSLEGRGLKENIFKEN